MSRKPRTLTLLSELARLPTLDQGLDGPILGIFLFGHAIRPGPAVPGLYLITCSRMVVLTLFSCRKLPSKIMNGHPFSGGSIGTVFIHFSQEPTLRWMAKTNMGERPSWSRKTWLFVLLGNFAMWVVLLKRFGWGVSCLFPSTWHLRLSPRRFLL